MAFAITKTWTAEILTASDLNGAFTEVETELNAFPTNGALAANSVGESQLQTNAVSNAKMQNDSVDEAEIVDGAVTEDKLGTGAVTNTKLGATCVTAAKISTIFGTMTSNDSDTNAINQDNIYKATSDGLLLIVTGTGTGITMDFYMDTNATPTTQILDSTGISKEAITLPIFKNNYFKIESNTSDDKFTIYWVPVGSGELQKQ